MRREHEPKLYLRGRTWWTWFRDHTGKRIRRSTHQRDRTLAGPAARRLVEDQVEGRGQSEETRLDHVIARYLASVERRGKAEATLDFYMEKSAPLLRHLGPGRDVSTLTLAISEAYIDARAEEGAGLATSAKELGLLRAALRYTKKHGVYRRDPSDIIPDEVRGAYRPRDRALSRAEYPRLVEALSAIRQDHLVAFVGAGPRDGELFRILPEDVTDAGVRIRGTKGQADRADRIVPVQAEVLEVFRRRAAAAAPGTPIFEPWTNMRRDLRAACRRAGIAPVSPNDLRRTFATWLAEAGVPELITAAFMGHASSAMVKRVYTRIHTAAQGHWLARLPPLPLGPGPARQTGRKARSTSPARKARRPAADPPDRGPSGRGRSAPPGRRRA